MKWEQFFEDHNIAHEVRGDRLVCNCPHHANDIDYFMRVYETGVTTCWICGTVPGVKTIEALLDVTTQEAFKIMKQYSGTEKVYHEKKKYNHANQIELPSKILTPYEAKYLHSRGITPFMIDQYEIMSGGVSGFFAYRVVFPIKDSDGEIISLRGRSIVNAKPKYKALPPSMELDLHKNHLYNEHLVPNKKKIVVVEGEIDSIKGGPGFVGTFGSDITTKQLIKIAKYDIIYYLRDNDLAGKVAGERVTNQLSALSNTEVVEVVMPHYKDVGSLDDGLIKELRHELEM